jgi:hypothetical protein
MMDGGCDIATEFSTNDDWQGRTRFFGENLASVHNKSYMESEYPGEKLTSSRLGYGTVLKI